MRWTVRRKVEAVRNAREMTPDQFRMFLNDNAISSEEFRLWCMSEAKRDMRPAMPTKFQRYRRRQA